MGSAVNVESVVRGTIVDGTVFGDALILGANKGSAILKDKLWKDSVTEVLSLAAPSYKAQLSEAPSYKVQLLKVPS